MRSSLDAGAFGPLDAGPDVRPAAVDANADASPTVQGPVTFRIHNAREEAIYLGYGGPADCDLAMWLAEADTPDAFFPVIEGWGDWCDCQVCELACDRWCSAESCYGELCLRSPSKVESGATFDNLWHGLTFSQYFEVCPGADCRYGVPIVPGDYLARVTLKANDYTPYEGVPNPSTYVEVPVHIPAEGGVVEVEIKP